MNKYIKYIILSILMLFFLIMNINATEITCDYSENLNGKEFKYRVVVSVDDELYTDSAKRNAKGNFYWNNHIYRYYYNVNSGKYDKIGNGDCRSADKYNIAGGQVCVLTSDGDKKDFFESGLSGSTFNCPKVYQYAPDPRHPDNILIIANKTKASSSSSGNNNGNNGNASEPSAPDITIYNGKMECSEILGNNLTKIVHLIIKIIRIAGAVITVLQASIALIPPITSGDADALKKAGKKCVTLAIILAAIGLFPTLLNIIGKICGFDLSCIA